MSSCPGCQVVQCVRHRGDDVCCSVVFGALVGVFSVMWSELLMASAISCPLWSSVYECHKVECTFASPVRTECGMFVMYCTVLRFARRTIGHVFSHSCFMAEFIRFIEYFDHTFWTIIKGTYPRFT